jgi:hypothetical protein
MTIEQLVHFKCDRCKTELNVPLNDQPANERNKPPEGWQALWLDSATNPAIHLCVYCNALFDEFMQNTGSVP